MPFKWALKDRRHIDVFVVLTDAESWSGGQHPFQAFDQYRTEVNPAARCIYVQMASNTTTLHPPGANDGNYLDVVGFDLGAAQIIEQFLAGNI